MLDPLLLRAFLTVVQTGGFTRAAASLHLTQATVSQQVRRLEEQVGAQLLERGGRYVVTPAEGDRMLGYANRIVSLIDEAELAMGRNQQDGEVRLGVPDDFAADSLTSCLADFADAHPGIRLEIINGLSHDVWNAFTAGELDLALIKQRDRKSTRLNS